MLQGTYYLVSHHHTVVYVDDDSKHLRHAPFAAARPNLIFEIEGDRARAMVIGASLPDRRRIALEREGDEIRAQYDDRDINFVVDKLPQGKAAVRLGTFYLSADLDGVVRNNRDWCREWEQYRLVGAVAASEELWHARLTEARCLRDVNDEEGFVRAALAAFRARPHRAEPLHDLSSHYMATKRPTEAAFYAEAAAALPVPTQDALLVDESMYRVGFRHAFAAAAYWSQDAGQKERGRQVCDWLALSREVPPNLRNMARYNAGWYAVPAPALFPTIQYHPLSIASPDGFYPANIGLCRSGDRLIAMLRTVNWYLKDGFWYVLQGAPPYRSHLSLIEIDDNLRVASSAPVLPPEDMPPPAYEADLGFADPRPFVWQGNLWCISLVRQLNTGGRSEMVLSCVSRSSQGEHILRDWRVLPSGNPARDEKNWMPQVDGDELRLIYSVDPTRILSVSGTVLHDGPASVAAESFRGSSQAIDFDDGWLMVVHEVEQVNNRRRYFHRFVWMDAANFVRRISRRFYLRKPGVEFIAGMAWHPDDKRLVLSFSVHDTDPTLAILAAQDVRDSLQNITDYEHSCAEAIEAGRRALRVIRWGRDIREESRKGGGQQPTATIVESMICQKRIRFFITNKYDAIMKHHYDGEFYEIEELAMIKRNIVGTGVFVDIGANIGNHAIYIAKYTSIPRIILFEPNPEAISILRENLALNACGNVEDRFLGIALAKQDGQMKGVTEDRNNLGHTYFLDDAAGTVSARKGDLLLLDEPVEFIKLDVEGMEVDILSGLEQTIRRWRPTIFIEVWDRELLPFLEWCARECYRLTERFQRYPEIQNFLAKPLSNLSDKAANSAEARKIPNLLHAVAESPGDPVAWRDLARGYRDAQRTVEAALIFTMWGELDNEAGGL